jgi:hypothetical protein
MRTEKTNEPVSNDPLFRFVWRAAALGVSGVGLAACCHMPPASCPAGKVPLVSNTTYAVYQAASSIQVEDTRTVQNRCIVPIGTPPAGPGNSSPAPVCPAGTVAIQTGTIFAEYFGVADASRQLEDMRGTTDRCIVPAPTGIDVCPPGTRPKIIQGATYCVPNP